MPVSRLECRKCPAERSSVQTGLHVGILRDVLMVVVINEIVGKAAPIDHKADYSEEETNQLRVFKRRTGRRRDYRGNRFYLNGSESCVAFRAFRFGCSGHGLCEDSSNGM